MNKKMISAIIACYKDEYAIPLMYERLKVVFKELKVDYEIIFVNDGSPDNTEQVLEKLLNKDNHVIAINHSRNFNSQMAFTSGMSIAKGDCLVFLDGDLQDPPEIITSFYNKWLEGYDVVYGIRTKREAPQIMQFAYKLFYRLFNRLSYIHIPLDAGDFSLIDKKVYVELKKFPERDRFLRGLRAWLGFKQIGVPYVRPDRKFGTTTNSLIKNFQWAVKGIFSFSYVPLQIMTITSLFVFFLSVIGIIYQILLKIISPESTPSGISTIIVLVLFIGSIQLLGISILGEYIGKIFEEVKQRPKFVVKSIKRRSN
ncbi:MAG: glycosyltransferase family 2 protein [Candidatus Pacebacteria bacterium]|jgi:polyisoprenyl-phosphate glycosyltransferase|nr:glycosyltransferase family 2 protein [Candidatus Paceibacterota bacterium]